MHLYLVRLLLVGEVDTPAENHYLEAVRKEL